MSTWQTEMTRLLRFLINDYTGTLTYEDAILEEILVAAAQLNIFDISFNTNYTIDIDTLVISPDPTTLSTKDNAFINLTVLKASCLILLAETKDKSGKAILIKDGPSTIDTRGSYGALKDLADQMCKNYDDAKIQYQLGNSAAGQAIIGPYTQVRGVTYPLNIT